MKLNMESDINWLDTPAILCVFLRLSNLQLEDDFSPRINVRTPRYNMNARRRVNIMDNTRSCLTLDTWAVRHCSFTLSSDHIFIKTQYFHPLFFHLTFLAGRGRSLFAQNCTACASCFTLAAKLFTSAFSLFNRNMIQ